MVKYCPNCYIEKDWEQFRHSDILSEEEADEGCPYCGGNWHESDEIEEIDDVVVSIKEEVKRDKVYLVPRSVIPSQFREIGERVLDAMILISADVEKVEIIKVKDMTGLELVEYLKEKGVKFS